MFVEVTFGRSINRCVNDQSTPQGLYAKAISVTYKCLSELSLNEFVISSTVFCDMNVNLKGKIKRLMSDKNIYMYSNSQGEGG